MGGKGKSNNKFTPKMQKKLLILFVLVLATLVFLCGRMIQIMRESGDQYKKQVYAQQRYDSTTLPYRRGDIVDTNGTKLAVSEKVYNLIIDAKVMLYKEDYLEPTLQALSDCFPDLVIDDIRQHVISNPGSSWYVALKQLGFDQIIGFKTRQTENADIRGVWFEEEYKRAYPQGTLACDVIGFTTSDNVGKFGLEEYYNTVLNGTNGREYGYLNDDADLERTVKPAEDGYTIHTTIDVNIQGIVEKYIKEFNDTYKDNARPGNGADNIGCIIMEVNTGNVLAMAGYPVFDLNNPRDISAYYTEEEIAVMQENDTYYEVLNQMWRNYCISDTYEPGSTAKPFTVAMGLESDSFANGADSVYYCEGSLEVGGHTIKCHTKSGDLLVTVQDAVARSCNVALMKMSNEIGIETFCQYQKAFNFGLKTNIDLPGEANAASLMYTADTMSPTDLVTNAFGQNFNTTMIQLISGFCSLINGGYYYEPHVVNKITNASGATVKNIEPRVLRQTISESTSSLIRQYCRAVVMEEGGPNRTGRTARPAGYAIGGKTGTAQTLPRGNGEYVVSFIGYAPADDPRIAIYVVIDRPNIAIQDDAKFATKMVRNILTEVLPYMGIFMTEELSEEEIKELEERNLARTNMYTQTPEEDALGEMGDTQETEQGTGTEGENPSWMSYEKDPATGFLIDPDNGDLLDPDTGNPVNRDNPAIPNGLSGSDYPQVETPE